MNKIKLKVLLFLFFTLLFSTVLSACVFNLNPNPSSSPTATTTPSPSPTPTKYKLQYTAGEGGSITGTKTQTVSSGGDGTAVTAVADTNFIFLKWSDNNSIVPTRTDTNITNNIIAAALFERTAQTFTYNYRNATENNTTASVTLYRATLSSIKLVKPEREHFTFDGWYLDNEYTAKVSDNQGNITIGNTVFDSTSATLYAKWTVNQTITYKVLMVFTTEVNATLSTREGQNIEVAYKMSEVEKQICVSIGIMVEKTLNEMFDGLVAFEVDNYFTEEIQGRESFTYGIGATGQWAYMIFAENIPELQGKMGQYGSVITTFGTNDWDFNLIRNGGNGLKKFACIPIETVLMGMRINNIPFETMLDISNVNWDTHMSHYLHEFTHTLELYFGLYFGEQQFYSIYGQLYDFHDALSYYAHNTPRYSMKDYLGFIKLYLLNQMIIDGQRVGIPYEFWLNTDWVTYAEG